MSSRPKLKALRANLGVKPLQRVQTLVAKPDVVERKRGRAGVNQRQRIRERDRYVCVMCRERGIVRRGDEVDHRIPLEDGGSDEDDNLWLLCAEDHAAKTAREASARAGRR